MNDMTFKREGYFIIVDVEKIKKKFCWNCGSEMKKIKILISNYDSDTGNPNVGYKLSCPHFGFWHNHNEDYSSLDGKLFRITRSEDEARLIELGK